MRKILLFLNPVFDGRARRDLGRIIRTFQQAGIPFELLETGENRAAGAKAKQAIEQDFDAIIVCGGDGTVFDVIQGMAGSSVPLGIIPFGTGNILAQNLKIPKDPAAAARWLLRSKRRSVPLGKVTCCHAQSTQSWFFAMSAGMGLHAALMTAARGLDKRAKGKVAYFAAGIRLLFEHPVQPFAIEVTTTEGRVISRRVCEALAVRVAELNSWRPGGDLDRNYLRLATLEGDSMGRVARAVAQALLGPGGAQHGMRAQDSIVHYENCARVVCRPIADFEYSKPIEVQADGEVLGSTHAVIEMSGVDIQLLSGGG
jgi:diacylglycerol kinase (ATP)